MNNWQNKIDELKEGCGKVYVIDYFEHMAKCGMLKDGSLCPVCQAKLTQLQEDKTFYDTELKSFAEEIKEKVFQCRAVSDEKPVNEIIDKLLQEKLGKSVLSISIGEIIKEIRELEKIK
jgi:uncharacterized Zn finger protein (UPF0148 family)